MPSIQKVTSYINNLIERNKMYPSKGLQVALNAMRQTSIEDGTLYHKMVSEVTDKTTIGEFGAPILDTQNVNVLNEFVDLLKKVISTAVYNKTFNNPLVQLEGERMPLGNFIEEAYINPANNANQMSDFSVDDYMGLLSKYEAQVAVSYLSVNRDKIYSVSLTRDKIRTAFTSWSNLEQLISGYINSLYNASYIQRYRDTKMLPVSAFQAGAIKYEVITNPTDEATAKALVRKMRADYTKMQIPSTDYNAWQDVKGQGAFALQTWTDPQDIVVIITSDLEALIDTDVLSASFNMSKSEFLGRLIVVDSFDVVENGVKVYDGSKIKAMICDRAWFKIKTQDFSISDFWNPRNKVWNYFLNDTYVCNYSLFANAKLYTTGEPTPSGSDS